MSSGNLRAAERTHVPGVTGREEDDTNYAAACNALFVHKMILKSKTTMYQVRIRFPSLMIRVHQ